MSSQVGNAAAKKVVVLIRQEGLGQVGTDDRSFGLQMLDRFLHTLESQPVKPHAICFYTEGVKVACEGSPVLTSLHFLDGMGVKLVISKTCVEYFGLKDKVAVGIVGGMNDIAELLLEADHVVTL